ncbi:MAG: hypothetical protein MN733_42075, partial [Nitrososphaera sp.]|nr:hypothetical protein [Nitrososphaera sp.]
FPVLDRELAPLTPDRFSSSFPYQKKARFKFLVAMSIFVNIISDWTIAIIVMIHTGVIAWVSFNQQQRAELKDIRRKTADIIYRGLFRVLLFTTPAVFLASFVVTPWPPSKLGLASIVVSGMLCISLAVLRAMRSSIDAMKVSIDVNKMQVVFIEELAQSGVLNDEAIGRIRQRMADISKGPPP